MRHAHVRVRARSKHTNCSGSVHVHAATKYIRVRTHCRKRKRTRSEGRACGRREACEGSARRSASPHKFRPRCHPAVCLRVPRRVRASARSLPPSLLPFRPHLDHTLAHLPAFLEVLGVDPVHDACSDDTLCRRRRGRARARVITRRPSYLGRGSAGQGASEVAGAALPCPARACAVPQATGSDAP